MARAYLRLQFTFTHPDDVAAHGAGPHIYDEHQIVALPGRELAGLEALIGGTAMPEVMNGLRESTAMGDLAATYLALHLAGVEDLGPFDEYEPHTMMIEWEAAPAAEMGKDEVPRTTSARSETVTLPSLPEAE